MPIMTMMRLEGDPEQLLRDKAEHIDPIVKPIAAENGGIEHLVAKTDDGLLIVNLWENEEGMEAVSAAVRPEAEAKGLAEPKDWQQYELLQRETP